MLSKRIVYVSTLIIVFQIQYGPKMSIRSLNLEIHKKINSRTCSWIFSFPICAGTFSISIKDTNLKKKAFGLSLETFDSN